jgi:DNA-binding NarL/FixJ family response regulator
MTVRVLIVEDHESSRRYVSSVLETNARFEVVEEVADGLAAVHAATRLKPDLVVLDIGLPTLKESRPLEPSGNRRRCLGSCS